MTIKCIVVCDECYAEEVVQHEDGGYPGHWLGLQGGHAPIDAKAVVGIEYGRLRSLSDTPKWFCSWDCLAQFATREGLPKPLARAWKPGDPIHVVRTVDGDQRHVVGVVETINNDGPVYFKAENGTTYLVGPLSAAYRPEECPQCPAAVSPTAVGDTAWSLGDPIHYRGRTSGCHYTGTVRALVSLASGLLPAQVVVDGSHVEFDPLRTTYWHPDECPECTERGLDAALAEAAGRGLHGQAILSGESSLHLMLESLDRVCPRSNPVEGDQVHLVGEYPQHAEGTFRGWRSDGISFYAAIESGDVSHVIRVTGQGRAWVYLAKECPLDHLKAQAA